MLRLKLIPWGCATAIALSSASAQALNITMDLADVDPAYTAYFLQAQSFWQSAITGYRDLVSPAGVHIVAKTSDLGGVGGVLGQAGPGSVSKFGGFWMTSSGTMEFDIHDLPGLVGAGTLDDVVRHEMAHVLGFGTLWGFNHVYQDGTGVYTGSFALATYRSEFNRPGALHVPIELGGSSGTADGHWDEVDNGGSNTAIVDSQGRDMRFELMTGWLDTPTFTSRTTVASFYDIGYTVNLSAVPEPAAVALWLLGIPLLAGVAVRRRAAQGRT